MASASFQPKLYKYLRDISAQQTSLPHQLAMLDSIQKIDPEAANTASLAMFDQVWNYSLSSNKGSS